MQGRRENKNIRKDRLWWAYVKLVEQLLAIYVLDDTLCDAFTIKKKIFKNDYIFSLSADLTRGFWRGSVQGRTRLHFMR